MSRLYDNVQLHQERGYMMDVKEIGELVKQESAFIDDILAEVRKVIVGQTYMVERLLIGLLTGGHVLVEGVPGLAKTLTISTLSKALSLQFQRIQFTPDLLPSDIVGTMIYLPQTGEFKVKQGPVFTNLVLADEINRAPAKVQSALLEAMQERQVTIGDDTYSLPKPFLVMATQNPIEQEGTYQLPEAQLDRFLMMLKVGYPTPEEELEILEKHGTTQEPEIRAVAGAEQIFRAQYVVEQIYVDPKLKQYIVSVVFATRDPEKFGVPELKDYIDFGASPRASIALLRTAQAHAFLKHRTFVRPEDIKAVGFDVLRHRIVLNYEAEAEDITTEHVIQRIFDVVQVP